MDPGALLPQIDKFKQVLIEASLFAILSKKHLMCPRRAGGHHYPIKVIFLYLVSNPG
jgi:hypothetical protein